MRFGFASHVAQITCFDPTRSGCREKNIHIKARPPY
jgi:hypothetical protein